MTDQAPGTGEYGPSPRDWVREQVEVFEASGGTRAADHLGMPIVVVTMRGARSGKIRKVPLMRVEHEGRYALVASLGGAPANPVWYANVVADPRVVVQDGASTHDLVAREVDGDERAQWWERAVAAYPDYADYQLRTERVIPVFVAEPAPGPA